MSRRATLAPSQRHAQHRQDRGGLRIAAAQTAERNMHPGTFGPGSRQPSYGSGSPALFTGAYGSSRQTPMPPATAPYSFDAQDVQHAAYRTAASDAYHMYRQGHAAWQQQQLQHPAHRVPASHPALYSSGQYYGQANMFPQGSISRVPTSSTAGYGYNRHANSTPQLPVQPAATGTYTRPHLLPLGWSKDSSARGNFADSRQSHVARRGDGAQWQGRASFERNDGLHRPRRSQSRSSSSSSSQRSYSLSSASSSKHAHHGRRSSRSGSHSGSDIEENALEKNAPAITYLSQLEAKSHGSKAPDAEEQPSPLDVEPSKPAIVFIQLKDGSDVSQIDLLARIDKIDDEIGDLERLLLQTRNSVTIQESRRADSADANTTSAKTPLDELINRVYAESRAQADQSNQARLFGGIDDGSLASAFESACRIVAPPRRLVVAMASRKKALARAEKQHIDNTAREAAEWMEKVDRLEAIWDEIRRERGDSATAATSDRRGYNNLDMVRSEAEFQAVLQSLNSNHDTEIRAKMTAADVPALILDKHTRAVQYDNCNLVIRNPVQFYLGFHGPGVWSEDEADTFCRWFAVYPKLFGMIASQLAKV